MDGQTRKVDSGPELLSARVLMSTCGEGPWSRLSSLRPHTLKSTCGEGPWSPSPALHTPA
jgi:hypothetical protein